MAPAKSSDHLALGRALRELRVERGLSQEQLGFESDLHRNYVGGCERGEINLSFAVILQLTRALGVTVSDLIGRYEEEMTHRDVET
jgi:transcriptional regulator with XRE-family HTH domain